VDMSRAQELVKVMDLLGPKGNTFSQFTLVPLEAKLTRAL